MTGDSVPKVWFSPVRRHFLLNLNLNLLQQPEPEPEPGLNLVEPVQQVQFRFRTQFEPLNQSTSGFGGLAAVGGFFFFGFRNYYLYYVRVILKMMRELKNIPFLMFFSLVLFDLLSRSEER